MTLDDTTIAKLAQAVSAEIIKHLSVPTVQPVLFSVKEAGVYLGRSEQSIQHLIADCTLPVVRVGRRVHLHRADLDRWVEKNKF